MNIIRKLYGEFWSQTRTEFAELRAEIKNQDPPIKKIGSYLKANTHCCLFFAITLAGILQLVICVAVTNGECVKEFLFYNPTDPFNDMFMDYYNSMRCVFMDNPYGQAGVIYPPLCYLMLYLFSGSIPRADACAKPIDYKFSHYADRLQIRNSRDSILSYYVFFIICTLVIIYLINYFLRKNKVKNIFLFDICVIFSWGFIYAFDRGNFLLPLVIFILLFLILNESSNKILRELSLVCLACAISLKIYPVFFAVILLTDRQYSRFVRTGVYSAILFFVPMLFFGGYESVSMLMQNIFYASGLLSSHYLGSNFNIVSQILVLEELTAPCLLWDILKKILPAAILIFGLTAAFFHKKKWKKILCLTCVFLMFSGTTMIYNLLYLIPPLIYFFAEKDKGKFDLVYAVLFAFCSISLPYVVYVSRSYDGLNITAGFILLCVSVSAMTFIIIGEGIKEMVKELRNN